MSGLSPKYPLTYDGVDGYYTLNKKFNEMVQQNLKNLILTSPGERIMDSKFGVGLYNFLFEQDTVEVRHSILESITNQVSRYMPFLEINGVQIYPEGDSYDEFQSNFLGVIIEYTIPSLGVSEELEIIVSDF
jgi:phage baseplate assembly protein W